MVRVKYCSIVSLICILFALTVFARISDTWDYWLPMGISDPNIQFDHMQMKTDWTGKFLEPIGYEGGVGTFYPSNDAWSQTYNEGYFMICDGNSVSELFWSQYFADSNEILWHLQGWDGGTLVFNYDILKNAGEWWKTPSDGSNIFPGTWNATRIDGEKCIADFNIDGVVNSTDFWILVAQWKKPPGIPSADIAPQPDGDGIVNYADYKLFRYYWRR